MQYHAIDLNKQRGMMWVHEVQLKFYYNMSPRIDGEEEEEIFSVQRKGILLALFSEF